jgi:hypothetical protein
MPDPVKPASKRYRLENRDRTRARWVFELKNDDDTLVEIVLGDPADRDIADDRRTKLTSSPEIIVSDEQIARFTPASKRTFDILVKRGQIEMRML